MFKGTAKNPTGHFSQVVATIGGQENAFTSSDYTGYFQRVPTDQLKTVMEFEADRMTGLVLTDEVVLPERDVILEEQNQRVANNPGARLGEQIDAALFLNHPYGKPVIGWRHEMEQLSRDDALAFYKRFYGPNNAIVVIAGDVDTDQVRGFAEETYGKVGAALRYRAAPTSAGAAAGRGSFADAGRSEGRAAVHSAAIIWCLRSPPRNAANPRRSKCWRISSAAAPTAGFIARWWWIRASR